MGNFATHKLPTMSTHDAPPTRPLAARLRAIAAEIDYADQRSRERSWARLPVPLDTPNAGEVQWANDNVFDEGLHALIWRGYRDDLERLVTAHLDGTLPARDRATTQRGIPHDVTRLRTTFEIERGWPMARIAEVTVAARLVRLYLDERDRADDAPPRDEFGNVVRESVARREERRRVAKTHRARAALLLTEAGKVLNSVACWGKPVITLDLAEMRKATAPSPELLAWAKGNARWAAALKRHPSDVGKGTDRRAAAFALVGKAAGCSGAAIAKWVDPISLRKRPAT